MTNEFARERANRLAQWMSQLYHASMCQTTSVIDPSAPSQIRIFAKSMYMFAAGWLIAALWLWYSGVQQHILRHYEAPPQYALRTLIIVISPVPFIALSGLLIRWWSGPAPTPGLNRREWIAGFWWALCPNWIMFTTVYVMIRDLR
jgi:hypothetical protein